MQEREVFYFQKFFKKAYYCIDTMQILMSDNTEDSLLEMSLITTVYWIMNISQQDVGLLTKNLE